MSSKKVENQGFKAPKSRKSVVLGLIPVALVIGIAAYVGLQGMEGLLQTLDTVSVPNRNLLAIQEIKSELFRAESAVRTRGITGIDSIGGYEDARSDVNKAISVLRSDGFFAEVRIDSLEASINEKFALLDQLNSLDNYRTDDVLERVRESFGPENLEPAEDPTSDPESGKKRKNRIKPKKQLVIVESELDSLLRARTAERDYLLSYLQDLESRENQQRTRDLLQLQALTREDIDLTLEIVAQLDALEQEEIAREAAIAGQGVRVAQEANRSVIIGIAAAAVLFLGLAVAILLQLRRGERYQSALRETVSRERAWIRARESFLATMSHELRTPLHAILGFTTRLKGRTGDSEAEEYVGIIERSGRHLREMVDGWLEYAREDTVGTAIRQEDFHPALLVEDVLNWMRPQAEARGLKLMLDSSTDPDTVLSGDPVRIRGVLLNLLGNAIKYTPDGEVRLTEKLEARKKRGARSQSGSRVRWTLAVSDTGVGIPEEAQALIFEKFRMLDNAPERDGDQPASSGLGLAITRNLVEKLGGKLSLESAPGRGSTFTVSLNMKLSEQAKGITGTAGKGAPEVIFEGLRILVADDEPYNRKLISSILSSRGIDATIVSGGQEAVSMARENQYDLLLLDWRMPDLDAVAVRRELVFSGTSIPPSAVLTAGTEPEVVDKLTAEGFDEVLSKPFEEHELWDLIHRLSRRELPTKAKEDLGAGVKERSGKSATDSGLTFDADTIDLAGLEKVSGGDSGFVQEMLQMFGDNLESYMQKWETYREVSAAPDKHEATITEWAEQTHKLAAPCRHLGMKHTANALRNLEKLLRDQPLELHSGHPLLLELDARLIGAQDLASSSITHISAKAGG